MPDLPLHQRIAEAYVDLGAACAHLAAPNGPCGDCLADAVLPLVSSSRDDVGGALVALYRETEKLLDMLSRDGRLWVHAADPLPRLAADVYAAVISQPEPT